MATDASVVLVNARVWPRGDRVAVRGAVIGPGDAGGERIEAAAGAAGGGWLRGRGWREEEWPEGERPDLAALDDVTGGVPAALRAHDGHTLWVNSAALDAARGAATGRSVA